jgi:bacterioferritin
MLQKPRPAAQTKKPSLNCSTTRRPPILHRCHHFMARGIQSKRIADELLVQNEEQGHAGEIAEPIVQLSGEPDLAPDGMVVRSHAEYVEGKSLVDMIEEDQIAERIAIGSYRWFIQCLGNEDPTMKGAPVL